MFNPTFQHSYVILTNTTEPRAETPSFKNMETRMKGHRISCKGKVHISTPAEKEHTGHKQVVVIATWKWTTQNP